MRSRKLIGSGVSGEFPARETSEPRPDEEEREELPLPGLHFRAEHGPSIIFAAFGVAAFAREVEGEACAPGCNERGHDVDAQVGEVGAIREEDGVGDGHDRPDAIDPGVLLGDRRECPADEGHGCAAVECVEKRRIHREVNQRIEHRAHIVPDSKFRKALWKAARQSKRSPRNVGRRRASWRPPLQSVRRLDLLRSMSARMPRVWSSPKRLVQGRPKSSFKSENRCAWGTPCSSRASSTRARSTIA